MKTPYTFLVVVPAGEETAKSELMEKLATKIDQACPGASLTVVDISESGEVAITETAGFLGESLTRKKVTGTTRRLSRQIETGMLTKLEDLDDSVEKILKLGLGDWPGSEIPVLVMDIDYAEPAPRIFITRFLEGTRIIEDVDLVFQPGEAGIVDCERCSRRTLLLEGRAILVA